MDFIKRGKKKYVNLKMSLKLAFEKKNIVLSLHKRNKHARQ